MGIVTSIVFVTIGTLFAFGALLAWKQQRSEQDPRSERREKQELSEWVLACRTEGAGRLVSAVVDTHLPTANRVEALKEVARQYRDLGLPSKEDAYKLLSAREDLNRALSAGLSSNPPALLRASLLALRSHELNGHSDSVAELIQRVLTNPTVNMQSIRLLAIQYLSEFGQRAHEEALIDVVEMGQLEDREAAIKGLTAFGTAKAVPGLQATAADPTMLAIRGHALAAVTAIQTRIGPVEPGLVSLSEDTGNLSLASAGGELSAFPNRANHSVAAGR